MISRRNFIATGAIAAGSTALMRPAFAMQSKVFIHDGLAIRGIDPVAYFQVGAPTPGNSSHTVEWMGAVWQFSSEANKTLFEENPEAYAPKYGGYCAYAVSKGATATTAPEAWTVFENRLYLNYSTNVREIWNKDIPENVRKADENWPDVLG